MNNAPINAPSTLPELFESNPQAGVEPDIDYDALLTEDHKPVERIYIEKLYRLLTSPLLTSWPGPGRAFVVLANVGWFYQRKTPAVAPDILFSLDVAYPEDLHVKQGHSYYQWNVGKQLDVLIEAVSDRNGGEDDYKMELYARLGVPYYAIFDPDHCLSAETLRTFELAGGAYRPVDPGPWPTIGLGLRLWRGPFEGVEEEWLRWCDARGEVIPTAEERAAQADQRAAQADQRAAQAEERNRLLEAELRQLRGEPPA